MRQRVFIVAVRLWAQLLEHQIERLGAFEVVGSVAEGATDFAELERICTPGCIVVIDATTRLALQTATALNRSHPSTRIVAVGLDGDPGQAIAWATAGAVGLVESSASYDELLNALSDVSDGEAHCSAGISGALLRGIGLGKGERRSRVGSRWHETGSPLSSREQEVAWLVAGGFTNKEIAERLHISPGTVKSHVHNVIHKLGVVRRGHIAVTLPQQAKLANVDRSEPQNLTYSIDSAQHNGHVKSSAPAESG